LGFGKDAKNLARYRVSEVKNGRLAMLAISGILTQAAVFPDKVLLLHRVCSCVLCASDWTHLCPFFHTWHRRSRSSKTEGVPTPCVPARSTLVHNSFAGLAWAGRFC